jgi:hypothetical protein
MFKKHIDEFLNELNYETLQHNYITDYSCFFGNFDKPNID